MSCIFGENRDVFFPKLNRNIHLITFSEIAVRYLKELGYEPYLCSSEDEAREKIFALLDQGRWPCLFTKSDTTGEKDFEEFYTDNEVLEMDRFENVGIIKNKEDFSNEKINFFSTAINELKYSKNWNKNQLLDVFFKMIPDFGHKETGKYLDSKM
jgi:hypothetical protein